MKTKLLDPLSFVIGAGTALLFVAIWCNGGPAPLPLSAPQRQPCYDRAPPVSCHTDWVTSSVVCEPADDDAGGARE